MALDQHQKSTNNKISAIGYHAIFVLRLLISQHHVIIEQLDPLHEYFYGEKNIHNGIVGLF